MPATNSRYQILARRYRPQLFSEVCGQEAIVTTLKNSLRTKRLAYAYLFCGTRGTGKTTLARLFAKALNCAHPSEDGEPCNACQSCREILQGNSLDVLEIDGASNRGIDDIRQMTETVGYAPAHGKYKIYIIDEVHMLTKEAFNALLKTLEEPPAHVKFFFATTEPHKVLPTILSRCQRFDLKRIASVAMAHKLRSIVIEQGSSIDDEALQLLVQLADGSLRDAESLLDQLICSSDGPISSQTAHTVFGITPRTQYFRLDKAILENKPAFAIDLIDELAHSGKDLSHFLEGLMEHLRILLLAKWKRSLPAMHSDDEKTYQEHASQLSELQCMNLLDGVMGFWQQMGKTPFKKIFLEMLLLQMIRNSKAPSYSEIIQRLIELENGSPKTSTPFSSVAPEIVEHDEEPPILPTTPKETEETPLAPEAPPIAHEVALSPAEEEKQLVAAPVDDKDQPVDHRRFETLMRFAAVELEGSLN